MTPISLVALVHTAIIALSLLHILARSDINATTRIAWTLTLFALPVFGALAYFCFGGIRFGGPQGAAHRAIENATRQMVLASGEPFDLAAQGPASGFASAINGFGMTRGNRVELLDSPDAQRARLIADIDAARSFVHVFYYIWLDDGTGRAVAEALIRAIRRGVRVRAGVDAIGSKALLTSPVWQALREAGIETMVALPIGNPLSTMLVRRPDLRNHRKITVIDGMICHCGSQNCADPAFSPKPHYAPWIDVMARFEGPVARQMDLLFAQSWFEQGPVDLTPWDYRIAPFDDGVSAQVVGTGPTTEKGVTAQLLARILGEARREVMITTPYFVPGDVVSEAMIGAAMAGVDITLTVPHRNDSWFVGAASRAYYPRLLDAGVNIQEFEGGLLHAKILTMDGELTFFGSTNLDFRSFDLNFENDILVRDRNFAASMRERQLEYGRSSRAITRRDVQALPLPRRIWRNALASLGPLI
ncbi:MAG: cardiolipin synthase [Sphingobium sp.]|nr:cardiolipin synthase [Sphingobium sp.]